MTSTYHDDDKYSMIRWILNVRDMNVWYNFLCIIFSDVQAISFGEIFAI